jgi:SAM-dependent methyltransferase
MSQYEDFAYIYDELMSDVEYEKWTEFMKDHFNQNDKKIEMIAELGCGTGTMTTALAHAGYEMIGIDLSEHMLMVAREKASEEHVDILFLQQDMTKFELFGTVDAIIATCDSLNYVNEEELLKVFKLVENYLNQGGLFIFDLNTEYKFKEIYHNQTFSEIGEDFAYIWENHYNEKTKTNEYGITFFVEDESEQYTRFDEDHTEHVHSNEKVKELLKKAKLTFVDTFDDYSDKPHHNQTERITYIVKNLNEKQR